MTLRLVACVAVLVAAAFAGCIDPIEDEPSPGPQSKEGVNGDQCPKPLRELELETEACRNPSEIAVQLTGCTNPDNDFPVAPEVVPEQPFELRLSPTAYVALHIVSCEDGTLNGNSMGPVSYALVGPYIQPVAGAPDALVNIYGAECITDNAALQAWLDLVGIACGTGTIAVTESSPNTISSRVEGPGTYVTPERTHIPSSTVGYTSTSAFGAPGNGTLLVEDIADNQLGMVAPGTTAATGGYLGSLLGGAGAFAGYTSQGRGASIGLAVQAI